MIKKITNRIMPAMGISFIFRFKFNVSKYKRRVLNRGDTKAQSLKRIFTVSDSCQAVQETPSEGLSLAGL